MTERFDNSFDPYKSYIDKDDFCLISNLLEENIFTMDDNPENLYGSKIDFYNIYQQKIDHYNNKYIIKTEIHSNISLIYDSIFTLFDIKHQTGFDGQVPTWPYYKRIFNSVKSMSSIYYNGANPNLHHGLVNLVNLYPIIKDNVPFEILNISGFTDTHSGYISNYVYFGLYISNNFKHPTYNYSNYNNFGFINKNYPNMICHNTFALSYIDVDYTFERKDMDISKFSLCANALANQSLSSISHGSYTYTYYGGGDSISGILRLNVGSTIVESVNYLCDSAATIPESNTYINNDCKIIYELLADESHGGDSTLYTGDIDRTRYFYPQHFVLYNILKGLDDTDSYVKGFNYLYSDTLSMYYINGNNLFYLATNNNPSSCLSYIYINELYYHFFHNNKYYMSNGWYAFGNEDEDPYKTQYFEYILPKPNVTNINTAGCDINSHTYSWINSDSSPASENSWINNVPIRTNLIDMNTSSSVDEGAGLSIIGETGHTNNPIYNNEYFTLYISEKPSGICYIGFSNAALKYSQNGGTWTDLPAYDANNKATTGIVVNAGDIIRFKNNGQTLNTTVTINETSVPNLGTFKSSSTSTSFKIFAYGNLASLTTQDFINAPTLNGKALAELFYNFKPLIDAEGLYLPPVQMPNYCYANMFYGCTNLVGGLLNISQSLPDFCCYGMFQGCTSLEVPPVLNSTTLGLRCYYRMFFGCTKLSSLFQSELPAPSGTVPEYCYFQMFYNCTSLLTAPNLPSTKLSTNCYREMFWKCSKLAHAPKLPATTLVSNCYYRMFAECTSLAIAPELPAATLKYRCYYLMFDGCTKLKYIKCLATSISATECTYNWVNGVAATGTFVKADSMTSWTTGIAGIPSGWTTVNVSNIEAIPQNLTYPDDLYVNYAGASANNSYYYNPANPNNYFAFEAIEPTTFRISKAGLYYSLDNGNTWVSLPANTNTPLLDPGDLILWKSTTTNSTTSPYGKGVFSSTGKFKVFGNIMSLYYGDNFAGQTNLTNKNRAFQALFKGCTNLIYADGLQLPATTLSQYCYDEMFYGCINLLSAPQILPATTLQLYCYYYMFYRCSNLAQAPNLPALTLANYCYSNMFNGCTLLNYIECFATNISATNSHANWVTGVASSGTFVKNPSMASWPSGATGIPSGWAVVDYPG